MSNQRFTALTQILVLTLGAVVAIAQPVRSHTESPHDRGGDHLQLSFLGFIFPDRKERTRGSRNPSRGSFDESLPNVLTPRNTALFGTDALTLQWYPVAGASSYTVKIAGKEFEVTGTEATFDELESLVPNYRYTIVITADNGISSASGDPVGFTRLPETERERVNAQIDAIKAEQREPDEEALAIALEYFEFEHSDPEWSSYALNQAAIDVLESRIQARTDDSRIYLLQADTYWAIGLPLIARERYTMALTYAEAAGQTELQAESYWGLGDVAQRQTEYAEAIEHLQAAQAIYQELEMHERVEELQTQLEEIPSF